MRFQPVKNFISANDRFILTAHETPDGDAIGSEYALYLALKVLGKEVRIINADAMAFKYVFLDEDGVIETLKPGETPLDNLAAWSLFILDTNDIHNIGEVADLILPKIREYFIIDHHEGGEEIVSRNHIEEDASSTCEVLFQLFEEMKIPLNFPMAQALYVGIVYDTGSFVYPKTTAKTFGIAKKLIEIGVNPNDIFARIYESNSISALMLQSKVLASLELVVDQHIAIQTMLKKTIEECDAMYEEADTIINIPLKSENIKVSIFFKENHQGILRCSMRSKGNIDVAAIAQCFGGGGHKTAAGFKSKYPLAVIKEKVLKKLQPYFE
jgi:phosphoesterase RecJ-like protein